MTISIKKTNHPIFPYQVSWYNGQHSNVFQTLDGAYNYAVGRFGSAANIRVAKSAKQ